MNVDYFQANGRSLLGSSHPVPRLRAGGTSVLLCNPFGEEAARVHRAYRVLAGKLQDEGYATLRFDYSGTGDSSGDAADCTVEQWVDDIEAAVGELRRQSGSSQVVLIGLRFGATLAALCAQREHLRIAHLVLWDPVVRGEQYLHELAGMHLAYMNEELGTPSDTSAVRNVNGFPAESLGMPISAALAAQMAGIDIALDPPRTRHTTVVSTRDSADLQRLRAQWQSCPDLRWIDVMEGTIWNSDAALNSALVPAREIASIVSGVMECSPHNRGAD
ncbi:MAG: alpha/beta fold hydrolase [Pseudoxanthomonas sp.]